MKSIQDRINSLNEKLTFIKINSTLDAIVRDASCKKEECHHSRLNACVGSEHLACPGGSECSGKCKNDPVEQVKSLPPNQIKFDDGTVVDAYFIPGGY